MKRCGPDVVALNSSSTHCFSAEPFCCWRTRLTKNQRCRGFSAESSSRPWTVEPAMAPGRKSNIRPTTRTVKGRH